MGCGGALQEKEIAAETAFGVTVQRFEQFCSTIPTHAWRSTREGMTVRLPTRDEWTRAAAGVDGRAYPWGPRFDPGCAGTRDGAGTTLTPLPVGHFELDCSPYGVRDLVGGVLEWTGTIVDGDTAVIKGGSYRSWGAKTSVDTVKTTGLHEVFGTYGFRVAVTLPG